MEYTSWTHRQSYNYWSIQKCHYYCLKLDTGYSTVLYSLGSCTPTQRSWTITDFILHLHLHCRSIIPSSLHLFLFDFLWADCRCNCFVYPRSCSRVFTWLKLRALLPRRTKITQRSTNVAVAKISSWHCATLSSIHTYMSMYVCPQSFFDFNEIWLIGRDRCVMHDRMQYDPIQGQGHEPSKLQILSFSTAICCSAIYSGSWQLTTDS